MHTILGLDPGLANVGYGLVRVEGNRYRHVEHGVISTQPQAGAGARLLQIRREVELLIRKHRPGSAAVERVYFSRNTASALQVAEARGVLVLCLAEKGIPFGEYTPLEVKLGVLGRGSGRAEKRQVQEMLRLLLGLREPPRPYDAADALALAVCHANRTTGPAALAGGAAAGGAPDALRRAGASAPEAGRRAGGPARGRGRRIAPGGAPRRRGAC